MIWVASASRSVENGAAEAAPADRRYSSADAAKALTDCRKEADRDAVELRFPIRPNFIRTGADHAANDAAQ